MATVQLGVKTAVVKAPSGSLLPMGTATSSSGPHYLAPRQHQPLLGAPTMGALAPGLRGEGCNPPTSGPQGISAPGRHQATGCWLYPRLQSPAGAPSSMTYSFRRSGDRRGAPWGGPIFTVLTVTSRVKMEAGHWQCLRVPAEPGERPSTVPRPALGSEALFGLPCRTLGA